MGMLSVTIGCADSSFPSLRNLKIYLGKDYFTVMILTFFNFIKTGSRNTFKVSLETIQGFSLRNPVGFTHFYFIFSWKEIQDFLKGLEEIRRPIKGFSFVGMYHVFQQDQ